MVLWLQTKDVAHDCIGKQPGICSSSVTNLKDNSTSNKQQATTFLCTNILFLKPLYISLLTLQIIRSRHECFWSFAGVDIKAHLGCHGHFLPCHLQSTQQTLALCAQTAELVRIREVASSDMLRQDFLKAVDDEQETENEKIVSHFERSLTRLGSKKRARS
eukprot:753858-Hanusia_phi.AAC.14